MDLVRIGKFLSQLRREKELTQEELGERLGVTNKTVSRWENGNYLPPVEILQLLSEIYGLTINELLSAERLNDAEFRKKAEENIKSALTFGAYSFTNREKHQYFRRKWGKENLGMIILELSVGLILMFACALFREKIGFMLSCAFFLFRVGAYSQQYTAYMEDKNARYITDDLQENGDTANYKRQWSKEHFWVNLLYAFPPLAFLIVGGVCSDMGLVISGTVLGFCIIIVRMNAMRAYVERMTQRDI